MNANITSMFIVKPIHGRTIYAIAIDKGTEKANKNCIYKPHEEHQNDSDKNKSDYYRIIKLIDSIPGVTRLIACNLNNKI